MLEKASGEAMVDLARIWWRGTEEDFLHSHQMCKRGRYQYHLAAMILSVSVKDFFLIDKCP